MIEAISDSEYEQQIVVYNSDKTARTTLIVLWMEGRECGVNVILDVIC